MIRRNKQLKPIRQRLKACLDALDQRSARRLRTLSEGFNRLKERSAVRMKKLVSYAALFDRTVIRGGSKGIVKKRTGSRLGDLVNAAFCQVVFLLDNLDSAVFFNGRIYQAKECRVRSKAEKRIANCLTDLGFEFVYEKTLKLGKVMLHPDFYLVKHDLYLEYWGLAGVNAEYTRIMELKIDLYQKHGIKVVSLFPKHLKDKRGLETVLSELIKEATKK